MNTPDHASDSQINSLFELAAGMAREHAASLAADPTLAARLDAETARTLSNAETMFKADARDHVEHPMARRLFNRFRPGSATMTKAEAYAIGNELDRLAAKIVELERELRLVRLENESRP